MKRIFVLSFVAVALVAAILMFAPIALAQTGTLPQPGQPMTPEGLAALAGLALSLVLAYVPWVKDQYMPLPGEAKAAIMLVLLTTVAGGIFIGQCYQLVDFNIACTRAGALDLAGIWLWAVIGNQAAFAIAVEPFKPKVALPPKPNPNNASWHRPAV